MSDPEKPIDPQFSGEKPEATVSLPKPIWQMTLGELKAWRYKQDEDDPNLGDETLQAKRRNTRKAILQSIPPTSSLNKDVDTEFWYLGSEDKLWMMDNMEKLVHREAVEEAVKQGLDVPEAVLEDYPQLKRQVKERRVAGERQKDIKKGIEDAILADFDEVDMRSSRNFESIKTHFESKFSNLELLQEGSTVSFADRETGLIYVTVYRNGYLDRPYWNSFSCKRGFNYPTIKVKKPAVVVKDGEEIMTVYKGEIEN